MRQCVGAGRLLQQPGGSHRDDSEYPPPDQPVDPPGDVPTDPAEDTRTQTQTDFDEALKSARERLADARTAANNAVAAASAARTDDARTKAQTDIANARTALANAVNAAKALAELFSDPGRLGERAIFVGTAEAAQTEDLAKLLRAEAGTGWAGDVAATAIPPSASAEIKVLSRTLRKDSDGNDAATLLKKADIPAVTYSPGKTVMGGDLGGSGDRFQMRGMPIIYTAARELRYGISLPSATSDFPQRVVYDLASVQNNRPDLVAGLRITSNGLVVDMGGKGAEGTDFRSESFLITPLSNALRPFGTVAGSGQGNGYDLILEFGRPTASPEGNAEHYWEAALMPTAAQMVAATASGFSLKVGNRALPVGVYQVRLSNHVGLDTNQEDPDGPPYPEDDDNYYLSYAAYGFMDFQRPNVPLSASFAERGIQRVFPFHVGYDAFKDEAGMRTTNIDSAAITSGRFKGRTIALQFRFEGDLVYLPHTDTKRMRGDIELTATISGNQASNRITGKISNMEDWDPEGYWEPSTTITHDLVFAPGQIDAKGEFAGVFGTSAEYPSGYTTPTSTINGIQLHYPPGFYQGGYRGNFYGPHDSLEAAGTWAMSPAFGRRLAIAGSFGAAIVREDGTYGRVVHGTEASARD